MSDAWPNGSELNTDSQISVTINGDQFDIWDETRTEIFARPGQTQQKATWTFLCAWPDRIEIAAALLGGATQVGQTNVFLNGWPYPDNPAWVAQTVQAVPDGRSRTSDQYLLGEFQRSRITCTFGIPEWNLGTPNVGEQELDFCSHAVALSQSEISFFWASDDMPVNVTQAPVMSYTTVQFQQSVYNQAVLPVSLITSLVNHVNSSSFFGADPGTVLFHGGRSSRKITAAGATNWDISYSFEWNGTSLGGTTAGWNKLWRPGQGWQAFVVSESGGGNLFPSGNLNQLFTV